MQLPFTPLPPLAPVTPPHARGCGWFACALSRALPGGGRLAIGHYLYYISISVYSLYLYAPFRVAPVPHRGACAPLKVLHSAPPSRGLTIPTFYRCATFRVVPVPHRGACAPLRVLHSAPPSRGLTAPIFAKGNSLIIFPGDYNRPGNNQLFPIFAKK